MNQLMSGMQNLSNPVKIGTAVVGGAGLMAVISMFNGPAIAVVLAGLVFIGLLLLLYRQVLKVLAKRKAAPMAKALSGNSAAAPQGISDPARRARLDDMRKNYETGVEKFRAAGKNIYSLPWYLLVGEPGSGKTEAVRHCNVGFPPGLQDQLQGVGGTINMNWWFTNHAVILDTAGRLMFEEVEPGTTSEWQEFLKLLKKTRPNCPVNGMLLVVPAESLIRDTADSIERKGGKIAQQLDQIQRALGVRFPVFVVVTKCDLINGFREFFDDMKDPQLQHQILGWSNPAPLDEPFNAELIEKHLEQVQKRLVRRRLGLMLDPVHTEDPTARRTDQVDALFAFPEAMVKLAPRLRRYLEMIFVAGVWSAKPLFLRGIYFTSSMREGSALDADLAEALGMDVESLPEGRVWERDRAYFLRDLFMNKVFRERGLVTRAVNTKAQQRQRRTVVLAAGAVGAVALAAFTYLGWSGLKRDVVKPMEFWVDAGETYKDGRGESFVDGSDDYMQPIVSRDTPQAEDFTYGGGMKDPFESFKEVPEELRRLARFPEQLRASAEATVPVPWVFYPVAAVTGDFSRNLLDSERREASRVLIESSIVRPLIDAAAERVRIDASKQRWSEEATAAMAQLLRLEAARATGRSPEGGVKIAPLLKYAVLNNPSMGTYSAKDVEAMQGVVDWLYSKDGGAKLPPPAAWPLGETARVGSAAFTSAWAKGGPTPGGLSTVLRLMESLKAFQDAETDLLAIDDQFGGPGDSPRAFEAWRTRFAALKDAAERVEQDFGVLGDRSLAAAYKAELEKFRVEAGASHRLLLAELEPVAPVEGERALPSSGPATALRGVRESLERSLSVLTTEDARAAEVAAQLARFDALLTGRVGGGDPAFRARFTSYTLVEDQLKDDGAQGLELGQFRGRFDEVNSSITGAQTEAKRKLSRLQTGAPGAAELNPRLQDAEALCDHVLKLAGRQRRTALVGRFLAVAPGTGDAFADRVAQIAKDRGLSSPRPVVRLTRGEAKTEFDPRFNATAAAALLMDAKLAAEALGRGGDEASEAVFRAAEFRTGFDRDVRPAVRDYQDRFLQYWKEEQIRDLTIDEGRPWPTLAAELGTITQGFVFNRGLREVALAMQDAAQQTAGAIPDEELRPLRDAATTALATLREGTDFAGTCDRVLNSWRSLGRYDRVIDARKLALDAVQRGTFELDYAMFEGSSSAAGPGDFVLRFWEDFCFKSLLSLTLASEQEAKTALVELQRTTAFPLRRLADDGRQMSAAEVLAARDLVQKVRTQETPDAGGSGTPPPPPIRNEKFRMAIERLRTLKLLSDQERRWVTRLDAVLTALPRTEKETVRCQVEIITDRLPVAGQRALEELFPTLDIVQGGGSCSGRLRSRPGSGQAAVPLVYAGEDVRFCFFSTANPDNADKTVTFDGPWSALRMLHQYGARPIRDGETKSWAVEMTVPYSAGGQEIMLSLWLKLEFDRPIPLLEEWPE